MSKIEPIPKLKNVNHDPDDQDTSKEVWIWKGLIWKSCVGNETLDRDDWKGSFGPVEIFRALETWVYWSKSREFGYDFQIKCTIGWTDWENYQRNWKNCPKSEFKERYSEFQISPLNLVKTWDPCKDFKAWPFQKDFLGKISYLKEDTILEEEKSKYLCLF